MSKFYRLSLLLVSVFCLSVAQASLAQVGPKGNLVTPQWLSANAKTPDLLLLDASAAPRYAAKHIAGAANVSMAIVNTPFALQKVSVAEIEKMYRAAGIAKGKKIVIYDQGGGNEATRLFFSLYYHGIAAKDLFILDGGLGKWEADGLPVTKEPTILPANASFAIDTINESARARLPEVLDASGDPEHNVLLDALDGNWHFGASPLSRSGHIPGAVLLPAADFFNADKTFKPAEEIKRMLDYLGIRRDQQIYTYCGGGIAASVPYFALKFVANYPKVKLYTGSAIDWIADARDLPFWTYDSPSLLRNSRWLQFWGGQMLRMYMGTTVSIVDVRPAAEFNVRHVPFALNVPAEIFKANLNTPEKLAGLLGPAGVNSAHEAVIVSGAGLNPESALAFLMLRKLGQNRTSVLVDSIDTWANSGYPTTRDATAVGPQKAPNDVSMVPAPYVPHIREGITIADAKITAGVYPKIYIASGKDISAHPADATVVHVPYTEMLNADGTPKSAKDVWNVLKKAGVPRYAELVCFSDDPGEAAVNYFMLKLMGFPNVKVLTM